MLERITQSYWNWHKRTARERKLLDDWEAYEEYEKDLENEREIFPPDFDPEQVSWV